MKNPAISLILGAFIIVMLALMLVPLAWVLFRSYLE